MNTRWLRLMALLVLVFLAIPIAILVGSLFGFAIGSLTRFLPSPSWQWIVPSYWMLGISLVVVVAILLTLGSISKFNRKGGKENPAYPKNKTEEVPWYKKLGTKAKPMLKQYWIGLLLLVSGHGLVAYLSYKYLGDTRVWRFFAEEPIFWIAHVLTFVAFKYCRSEPSVLTGKRYMNDGGSFILLLTAVIMIFVFWNKTGPYRAKPGVEIASAATSKSFSAEPNVPTPLPDRHSGEAKSDLEMAAREFFRKNLPEAEANLMIDICGAESDFNQFEENGVSVYRRRATPDNPERHDVGICQVNEDYWFQDSMTLAESTGQDYSLYTLEGNLWMSIWIFKNRGPLQWTTYRRSIGGASQEKITVMAPVEPDWSERISTPGPFSDEANGPARVRVSSGRIFEIDKGSKVKLGQTTFVQFQSRMKETVNVTVSR